MKTMLLKSNDRTARVNCGTARLVETDDRYTDGVDVQVTVQLANGKGTLCIYQKSAARVFPNHPWEVTPANVKLEKYRAEARAIVADIGGLPELIVR